MSTDQSGDATATQQGRAGSSRHRWVPFAWAVYGAAYVVVFIVRGRVAVAAIAGAVVLAIAVGLALELRSGRAADRRLIGWEQDERQATIHLRAAAFVGYVAAVGALVVGFVEFARDHSSVTWPMNALGVLLLAYCAALVFYSRRT